MIVIGKKTCKLSHNQTCFCNSNSRQTCEIWQCHTTDNINHNIYAFPTSTCYCSHYRDNTTCSEWHCIESYDADTTIMNHTHYDNNNIYNASYRCLSPYYQEFNTMNASSFCWFWSADKSNLVLSEWKIASCECKIAHISYCAQWFCDERAMQYYHMTAQQFHVGWIVISVSGGIVWMCVCVKIHRPKHGNESIVSRICLCFCLAICSLLIVCTLLMLCFIVSGFAGVVVVCSVWIISIFVLSPFVKWLCKKRHESYWSEDEYNNNSKWNEKQQKVATYDFWSETNKAKYNQVYKYEPYDPI